MPRNQKNAVRRHHKRVERLQKTQKPRNVVEKQEEVKRQCIDEFDELKKFAEKIALEKNGQKYIVLTVGNLGYIHLLVNWWLSLNKNTDLSKHSIILTYDQQLVGNIRKKLPFCNIEYMKYTTIENKSKPSEKATAFKKPGWDGITRFKLKAIHCLIEWGYRVFYVDPDVYVINNSLGMLDKLIKQSDSDVLIQEGKPFCSGVIYAPPNETTKKLFSPKEWSMCGTDDENYIINFFNKKHTDLRPRISTLPLDRFPNGLKWKLGYTPDIVWKLIDKGEIDLLHFNYISGVENKIDRMRQYRMWSRQMYIINVPGLFKPDLNKICLQKNKSVYPPHQSGPQIEQYTYLFMKDYTKDKTIASDYDYLPIFWTSIALSEEPNIREKLRNWLRDFVKKSPNRKCWTVVQHCKGIQQTLGFMLPKDWIIFSTSDPNGVVQNKSKSEVRLQTVNFIPLHKRKMMWWHNSGFGRMPEKPKEPSRPRPVPPSRRHATQNQNPIKQINGENNPIKKTDSNKFYTKNHINIPLLSSVHKSSKNVNWSGKRRLLASFIGDINVHPIRKQMKEVLSKNRIIIDHGRYKQAADVSRFEDCMKNSTFALCPRGYGNTSFRLVEAMQYGAIPVYISDVFTLPFNDVIDWNSIAVLIKPEQFPRAHSILKDIESDEEKVNSYRQNIKNMYDKYFTMKGCCENMIRYITK
jgi:hypothetical protein